MHWLIQRGFDSDRQYLKLIEQIERMGIGHTFCTVVPFSDADNGIVLESEIPEGVNIFTYGSYTLSKHARARGYTPGAYLGIDPKVLGFTTDFDNLVHTPLAPYLLNSDLFINTFGNSNVPEWEEFFFKPNSDTKAWVAEIITRDKFLAFRDKIKDTLKYKCGWSGIHLIMAPTFYASSKYCSVCGHKHNELKLSDREWTCSSCGTHLDRDVNAAKNLQYHALWLMDKHLDANPTRLSSSRSYACGDERLQFLAEQCSSMKQEFKSQNHVLHSFA